MEVGYRAVAFSSSSGGSSSSTCFKMQSMMDNNGKVIEKLKTEIRMRYESSQFVGEEVRRMEGDLRKATVKIISGNKSAFISDRLIQDNILAVHEILHSLKTRDDSEALGMAIKLDMAKAYDRVECVLINGSPHSWIFFTAKRATTRAAAGGVSISHLFFTDDSVIFCQAKEGEAREVLRVLDWYVQDGFGKYLGLQSDFGAWKKNVFEGVRRNLEMRMNGWAEHFLSQAGRETLIKSVAMALPNYALFCFRRSVGICKEIERAIAGFWWSGSDRKREMSWVAWDKMKKIKTRAGLALRIFNIGFEIFLGVEGVDTGEKGFGQGVKELFRVDGMTWHEELIRSWFEPCDAALILSIPFSRYELQDQLIWHFTKHGDYSVKSGYKVACRMISSGELDNLLQGVGFGLWRLWKCRNDRTFNGVVWHPFDAIRPWQQNLGEYRVMEVQTREEEERGKMGRFEGVLQPSEQKKWKKLPFGSWKVNCDAVWNVKRGTGAVGWGHPRLCGVAANGRWHG
ncbi:hypothetical protein ACFX2I_014538 [Malus domestica]